MAIGDIVLVRFSSKVPPAKFKLGIVKEVKKDEKGLVRSCFVGMRRADAREKSLPYKSKDLMVQEIVVQRIVVLLPVELQEVSDRPAEGVLDERVEAPHVCCDATHPSSLGDIPIQSYAQESQAVDEEDDLLADPVEADRDLAEVNALAVLPPAQPISPDLSVDSPSYHDLNADLDDVPKRYLLTPPCPSASLCPKLNLLLS